MTLGAHAVRSRSVVSSLLLLLAIGLLFFVFPSHSTASASIHPTALDEDSNISLRNDAPDEIYRTDAVSAAAIPFDSSILTRAPHLIRRGQSSRLPLQVVRPATDAVYYRAQVKGRTLMCWMQNPALAGDQAISPWNRFEQLAEWGWTGPQGSNPIRINYSEERDPAMRRLVSSPRTGMVGQVEHKTTPAHAPVTLDGITYQYPVSAQPPSPQVYTHTHLIFFVVGNYGGIPKHLLPQRRSHSRILQFRYPIPQTFFFPSNMTLP